MLGVLRAAIPGAALAQTWPTLISLWKFDETSASGGVFADSGPANVPMGIVGTWADLSTGSLVQGIGGTSAYTNGSGHATIPANDPDHDLSELTISFYYQRNSAAAKHILLAAGDGTEPGDFSIEVLANGRLRGYHVGLNSSQNPQLRFFESTNGITGTNLQVGTAHRIDLTLGSLGARIYLNGNPLENAFILANTNGWNNGRTKYVGIFPGGTLSPADGAFDGLRIWDRQLTSQQIASLEPAQSITLAGALLPLVPTLDFLASDGTILGSSVVYVYDTNLGSGSGADPANAKEIQAAINAASPGQTLVAIAQTAGGTTYYNRPSGLSFSVSGTSGNPITLMARPGDTVVISSGEAFATFRTPSSGLSTKWEVHDASKKIWRSVSTGFDAAGGLSGVWYEGGQPQHILPAPGLTELSAPLGTKNIWTNYGGVCATIHTDGRVYIRMQKQHPPKMSLNNKWPSDGRLDYMPGWQSGGVLNFPASEDPRNYAIHLGRAPGSAQGPNMLNFTSRSWWVIGEGINTFGGESAVFLNGASNITLKRGTDICYRWWLHTDGSGTTSNITAQRRRGSVGSSKHLPEVTWKFGGPLENSHRPGGIVTSNTSRISNLTLTNCTIHGFLDIAAGRGAAWKIQHCTMIGILEDGFQIEPNNTGTGWQIHYCYFLDSSFGGQGNGNASAESYVSHCIFDGRCPMILDVGVGSEPYMVDLWPTHVSSGGTWPFKWYNNTIIWSPDRRRGKSNAWPWHILGDNRVPSPMFHEVFNVISVTVDYQRYTGAVPSGGAWSGHNDAVVCLLQTDGTSREYYDYCILHRDVPNAPGQSGTAQNFFHRIYSSAGGGAQNFSSLSAFLASAKFTDSKSIYAPGFLANSFEVNPQIPSAVPSVPNFDTRRNYRPAASQASQGWDAAANSNQTPLGTAVGGWAVAPSPWIGALDPVGTDMPVGVQNP